MLQGYTIGMIVDWNMYSSYLLVHTGYSQECVNGLVSAERVRQLGRVAGSLRVTVISSNGSFLTSPSPQWNSVRVHG